MNKKTLLFVAGFIVLGIALRLLLYGFVSVPWIIFDEYIYIDTAHQILQGSFITQLLRDQAYPPGWPFVIAAFTGFISDPFLQYRSVLLLTMLLSSITAFLAVVYFQSWLVGFFLLLYPPLLLYSANIMSETFYTFLLFVCLYIISVVIQKDLVGRINILISGIVVGLLLYSIYLVRSFGIVVFLAFISAALIYLALVKNKSKKRFVSMAFFALISAIVYIILFFIAKKFFMPEKGLYTASKYYSAFISAAGNMSLVLKISANQITAVLFELLWVTPLFFIYATILKLRLFKQSDTGDIFARLFVIMLFLASFVLTLVHMMQRASFDVQYYVFTRYLDPVIVLLFAYGTSDMIVFFKKSKMLFSFFSKNKRHLIILFTGFVLIFLYFWKFMYRGSYKTGNVMGIYTLSRDASIFMHTMVIPTALFFVIFFLFFYYRRFKFAFTIFVLFALFQWFFVVRAVRTVPRYVIEKYRETITQWQRFELTKGYVPEMCRYKSKLTSEVYYLYHFLYPYKYLKKCDRRLSIPYIIYHPNAKQKIPDKCRPEFYFKSGEVVYYCPNN